MMSLMFVTKIGGILPSEVRLGAISAEAWNAAESVAELKEASEGDFHYLSLYLNMILYTGNEAGLCFYLMQAEWGGTALGQSVSTNYWQLSH